MVILLINKFHYLRGGSETYYFSLAKMLKAAGHRVVFFSMYDEKNEPCEQSEFFVTNADSKGGFFSRLRLVKNMFYSREAYLKLNQLIKREKPDLAILNLVHKHLTCSVIDALKENKIRTFWVVHDLITVCPSYTMLDGSGSVCERCLSGDFGNCVKRRCIRKSLLLSYLSAKEAKFINKHRWYDYIDTFICPSAFYKNLLDKSAIIKSKVVYLPNPVTLDDSFQPALEKEKSYFLYVGRLSAEKGVETFIEAAKACPEFEFRIAGDGPIGETLRRAASGLQNVVFLGFVSRNNIRELLNYAKAVVIPSQWYENCPYSALESLAAKTPLIASNIGGLSEIVEEGVDGFLFEPGNSLDLIQKIRKMSALRSAEYESMRNAAFDKIVSQFNAESYVAKMLEL